LKVDYIEETAIRKAFAFEIDAEAVEKELVSRARDYAKKVKLPGFRAGKIPPDVVRKRFKDALLQDAAEAIVNKHVFEAIEGRGLKPVAAPKVVDLKIDEHQPMTFRAVFEVFPTIEAPDHHGLQIKTKKAAVAEEAIDAEIEGQRERHARFEAVEGRPGRPGDHAVVDVSWKPADGGKGGREENAMLEIGAADNPAEMNTALDGAAVGDTRSLTIAYPADHASAAMAGKTFDYTLSLKALRVKILPDVDDEFAKDLGADSLADLREQVRSRLLAGEERKVTRELNEALVNEYLKRASFDVPEGLIERHMDARVEAAARSLYLQGVDPTKIGMDWKRFRESRRDEAVEAARADLLLDALAHAKAIEATDEEVDAELVRLSERTRKSKEALRAEMEKEGEISALRARIRESKVLDLLKADARLDFE
jgi:trigger factor